MPFGVIGQSAQSDFDERAKFLRSTAINAITAGRHEDAIAPLERLLSIHPDAYQESIWLAQSYHALGRFEEEIVFLERAVGRWPADYQFAQMLGAAYLETGDEEKATEVWHAALRQEGAGVMSYIQIARAEWDAGMHDRAIETLKEARKFKKHYPRVTQEIVRMEQRRGNEHGAFLAAVDGFEHEEMPDVGRAGRAVSSFGKSPRPDALVRTVDSLAAGAGRNREFFEALSAVLYVELGDYPAAGRFLDRADGGNVDDRNLGLVVLRGRIDGPLDSRQPRQLRQIDAHAANETVRIEDQVTGLSRFVTTRHFCRQPDHRLVQQPLAPALEVGIGRAVLLASVDLV